MVPYEATNGYSVFQFQTVVSIKTLDDVLPEYGFSCMFLINRLVVDNHSLATLGSRAYCDWEYHCSIGPFCIPRLQKLSIGIKTIS